ncbi:MAG: deoxyribose-phosphate aldolase [Bacillota bacterium]|nr:deoxyribose-phosphate aldolase [Bacillota bacterium]
MDKEQLFAHVDYTLLRPTATLAEIELMADEAVRYGAASLCIPPCYISRVRRHCPGLTISTVVGFPFGYATCGAKVAAAEHALEVGADEIDMMINLTDVKNDNILRVMTEVAVMKKAVGENILKVIIETCYLTEQEKIRLCEIVTVAEADYIKTSTGFGSGGAQLADVKLLSKHIGERVKIKAAGGIRSAAEIEEFIRAGCARIGTSTRYKELFAGK